MNGWEVVKERSGNCNIVVFDGKRGIRFCQALDSNAHRVTIMHSIGYDTYWARRFVTPMGNCTIYIDDDDIDPARVQLLLKFILHPENYTIIEQDKWFKIQNKIANLSYVRIPNDCEFTEPLTPRALEAIGGEVRIRKDGETGEIPWREHGSSYFYRTYSWMLP